MIPAEKQEAVWRSLDEAFGTRRVEDVRRMTRGLSSDLVLRIVVQGSPYLLKINTQINEVNDPARTFVCMQRAAEAGLAPRVWYTNAVEGIAIIDWIECEPMDFDLARAQLPVALGRLHRLAPFPKAFDYTTAHKYFIWRLRGAGLLGESEVEEAFRSYERICSVYPRLDADVVSCHMDLKPENILFDGQRVWLIDWMAAALNDRYFDLAMVANFVCRSEADTRSLLESYFGRFPDAYEMARFFLMRQVLHLFSAAVFLLLGAAGKPVGNGGELPSFADFHDKIWAGEIDLANDEMKVVYGRVHWRQLLSNFQDPEFERALQMVAEGNRMLGGTSLLLPPPVTSAV